MILSGGAIYRHSYWKYPALEMVSVCKPSASMWCTTRRMWAAIRDHVQSGLRRSTGSSLTERYRSALDSSGGWFFLREGPLTTGRRPWATPRDGQSTRCTDSSPPAARFNDAGKYSADGPLRRCR